MVGSILVQNGRQRVGPVAAQGHGCVQMGTRWQMDVRVSEMLQFGVRSRIFISYMCRKMLILSEGADSEPPWRFFFGFPSLA